jgi:hypothetical protein
MTERRVKNSISFPKRTTRRLIATAMALLLLGASAPRAHAAGIVTHAWMGLEAIDRVTPPDLHALLDAHRDQVRAGAEFPDGGYSTRALGTPGGDYGEEAHWQRFIDAYVAQIRADASCAPLTDPAGPCAPAIAHLMGAAAHGMGDEVWDWLFEPNGPGFGESYLPPALSPFVGPGGLEAQFDIVAIARFARPVGPTPVIPDRGKIAAAFVAVNRADIDPAAFDVGESFLDVERSVEAGWAPQHIAALERAMPWTRAHVVTSAGGVHFAAAAIAGYYESLWGQLLGAAVPTRVSAVAPFDGQTNVPATGWTGGYSPGSNAGNSGGLTRIAAALSSALPYHPLAGFGSMPSELPVDALRLRDLETGLLVARKGGYPRIVPYNPEAGEHVVAFQPAANLEPCRWYQVETTELLVDARQNPVTPKAWQFQTSGCERAVVPTTLEGTLVCDATGSFRVPSRLSGVAPRARGRVRLQLTNCKGGANGAQRAGSSLPITGGAATFEIGLPGSSCADLGGPAKLRGKVRWTDADGKIIGMSAVRDDAVDLRGDVTTTAGRARAFAAHALALRIAPDVTGCAAGFTTLPIAGGKVTAWPE